MKNILFPLHKALFTMLLSTAGWLYAPAQTQTIRLFCAGEQCSELTFRVSGQGSVHVDWGNDTEGDYSSGILTGKCNSDTITITMPSTITGFDCAGFCISWLDVNAAPNLVSLNCSDNRLDALNIDSLPDLDELNCSNNRISSLNTTHNPKLRYLDCADNWIGSLSLAANTMLQVLSCSDNMIDQLDISRNDALTGLWNTKGRLESLDLSQCRDISSVVLSKGQLATLTLSAPTKLQDLWVDSNQLTTLDFRGTDALYSANISNNRLQSLDLRDYSAKTKIYLLDCSNNQLPFSSFYPYTKVENYIGGLQEPIYCGYDSLLINELTEFSHLVTNTAGAKIGAIAAYDAASDEELEKGNSSKDYQYLIGRMRFWHEIDSVYMIITCSKYPGLEIRTNNFVVYDPETVAVHSVQADAIVPEDAEDSIYDLSGRKIKHTFGSQLSTVNCQLPKGIYIINGKKVLLP